jgi:hypothetical protein
MAKTVKAIILAGVTGAVLIDAYLFVTDVLILHSATGMTLFQWDASNVLGNAAYQDGWYAVLVGCALHLVVSLCWATVFVMLAQRVSLLTKAPIWIGALFGVLVMLTMWYLVLPVGHAMQPTLALVSTANVLIAHTVFFGIPVALVAKCQLSGA